MIYYVIPARKGSKGLPLKNRKLFNYTAETIPEKLKRFVIVTTDDEEIYKRSLEIGFQAVKRPAHLSNDTASMKSVLEHVVMECMLSECDKIVLLYLTYPEREWEDVEKALSFYDDNRGLSLLCRKKVKSNPFLCMYANGMNGRQVIKHDKYRRQDYDTVFEISHFVFITEVWNIKHLNNNLYNDDTIFYPIRDVADIDYITDLRGVDERCTYDNA